LQDLQFAQRVFAANAVSATGDASLAALCSSARIIRLLERVLHHYRHRLQE
jgi:hypothetical protein